jgi:hypothetical protein
MTICVNQLLMRAALLYCALPLALAAQTAVKPRYPLPPPTLPEAVEIVLAMSAAPAEVSARADIYVLRGTEFVKARSGTNGNACMVARDLHEGSLYPICFDQEGTRTLLLHEMMETALRARGLTETEVKQKVQAARARGALPDPAKAALAYMMSPRQVLFSSAEANGVRVGAWHPHIMIAKSGFTPQQLGVLPSSGLGFMQVSDPGGPPLHEFVVLLPVWSDGTSAPAPRMRPPQ